MRGPDVKDEAPIIEPPVTQNQPINVYSYEFYVHYCGSDSTHSDDYSNAMNNLGAQGWQLIAVMGGEMYFQRVTGYAEDAVEKPTWDTTDYSGG